MPGTLRFVLFGLIALCGTGLYVASTDPTTAAPAPVAAMPREAVTDTAPGLVCGACWG